MFNEYYKAWFTQSFFAISACSPQSSYQTGINLERNLCKERAASPEQYRDCYNKERQSFEDYQRERKEAMEPIVDKDK
ncbi:MAG: hypothetical protein ACPG8A_10590 [Psychrobium sp.]